MNRSVYFLVGFLLCAFSEVQARVTVESTWPTRTFLQYEQVRVRITIFNESQQELVFGGAGSNADILFQIRDLQNRIAAKKDLPLFEEVWRIPVGKKASRDFPLSRLYEMRALGNYRVDTTIILPNQSLKDKTKLIEVKKGVVLETHKNKKTDRSFHLVSLNRDGQNELLLQILNHDETKILQTYFLGRHLKFYAPTFKVSREGDLAILHYISPQQMMFAQFKADGSPISKETLAATPTEDFRLVEIPESGFVVRGNADAPMVTE
jgi:hypothetical protein